MDNFESSIADLDLALIFAESAAVSECPGARMRNRDNAQKAFIYLRNRLPPLNDWRRAEIEQKLAELQRRLEELGEVLR
jgi:hypothetical protein